MLLSAIFDSNAGAGEQRHLGTMATEIMTSHYHKKLGPDLQKLSVDRDGRGGPPLRRGRISRIPVRRRPGDAGPARIRPEQPGPADGPAEGVRRRPRPARRPGPLLDRAPPRQASHDLAPRLPLRRLADRRRRLGHELRLQQRQYRELLPDLLPELRPERAQVRQRPRLLRFGQRAAVVGRVQHRAQSGERLRQESRT